MSIDAMKYDNYLAILAEELVPAVGCTEPGCLALAGAKLRKVLGETPQTVSVQMSGNLIKNTKSVTIPYSGGLKGIEAAIWLGILGGDADQGLGVLSTVSQDDITQAVQIIAVPANTSVQLLDSPAKLHLRLEGTSGTNRALVEILHMHTNFVRIERNGEILLNKEANPEAGEMLTDRSQLNVRDILAFADSVALEDIEPMLRPQVECNTALAEQGLVEDFGANVGKNLLANFGTAVSNVARAKAAAAADARMGGCQMPVVINSGSGNQGITVSIPVIVYARHHDLSEERLLRALCVSNLIAIHQKTGIGRLSAYCGAVSAACGSGAALAYMLGGGYEQVSDTITNTLANVSGIICDGAKPSCAAKIASSVDAAILAYNMAVASSAFAAGDGIVKENVEDTIGVIGSIASEGMKETDITVIKHMIRP